MRRLSALIPLLLLAGFCRAETVRVGLFTLFRPKTVTFEVRESGGYDLLHEGAFLARWLAPSGEKLQVTFSPEQQRLRFLSRGGEIVSLQVKPAMEVAIFPREKETVLAVAVPGGVKHTYRGNFSVLVSAENYLTPVVSLDLEEYVTSVVAAELPEKSPPELLKAQAVVTRSYALATAGRHRYFDFCDLTHCQVFQGFFSERILPNVRKAVQETASLVLSDGSRIIPGYYTGCCSGWTATPQLIWDRAETDGFRQVECRHEENCRWKHWKRTLSLETLGRIFPEARPEELASLTIAERSSVGDYVRTINCGTQYLSGEEFRRRLCQQHNWNSLPGLSFSLCLTQAGWELEGAGLGHGIGLCQAGAAWLARQGQSFPSILKYYFPDLTCRSAGSFPLNGSRRFGGNIIDNPVNPFNFTYQTPGQSVQK